MQTIAVPEQVACSCFGCVYNVDGCRHGDPTPASRCLENRTIFIKQPTARSNDPATSKGKRKVNKYEQVVLDYLKQHGEEGGTGKSIASDTYLPLNCITPRFAPLRRKGLIKDSGIKHDKQIVWVLA